MVQAPDTRAAFRSWTLGCCQFGAFLSRTNRVECLSRLVARLCNSPAMCLQTSLSLLLSFVSLLSYQDSLCVLDRRVLSYEFCKCFSLIWFAFSFLCL